MSFSPVVSNVFVFFIIAAPSQVPSILPPLITSFTFSSVIGLPATAAMIAGILSVEKVPPIHLLLMQLSPRTFFIALAYSSLKTTRPLESVKIMLLSLLIFLGSFHSV